MFGLRQYVGFTLSFVSCIWAFSWGYITPLFIDFSEVPIVGSMLHNFIALIGGGALMVVGIKVFYSDL